MTPSSSNFADLGRTDPLLAQLGYLAERYLFDDPNTALLKLRQYAEALTQVVAARSGLLVDGETQHERLARLRREGVLPQEVWQLLTELRRSGNEASHAFTGEREQAQTLLQFAWILGVWLIRTFHDAGYIRGEFIEPQPAERPEDLRTLLAQAEAARQDAEARLAQVQAQAPGSPARVVQAAQAAATQLDLSEEQTRQLIDAQLRSVGWEVDSAKLRYGLGIRPEAGRSLAIAEWPTATGPADYVLFLGTTPVAVVEAKRKNKAVMSSLEQAARYSQGFDLSGTELTSPGGPWGTPDPFRIPFLYATNGRPYLTQLGTQSGIWFRDARRGVNPSYPLPGWHTPEGLRAMLEQDASTAEAQLAQEDLDYSVGLRPYQREAILAVEAALRTGQRDLLLAMATGTGKTKTAIALIYRLLKTGRFRRVLFLVDRETLAVQAEGSFATTRLEGTRTFAETFGLTGIDDGPADASTAVHITTVQGLARRVLSDSPPPVDTYDLIVVDEAHRGYTLDRDLAEAELGWRDESEYVSRYRQVLEHFDAVKVALTATPALHTTQIFGLPVFAYTYRDAVLDGVLVDHDPPYLIETELSTGGLHFRRGDTIPTYTPGADATELYEAPDDIGLEVEDFNRRVITRGFNRAVCAFLAQNISPAGPEKTLIFCVNDLHADEIVVTLKEELRRVHGEIDDGSVVKITSKSDQPRKLTHRFRTEVQPAIAVTVDLLTTGIDVPAITNLVFLRRVGSRILFEQMLGRATRQAPDIGKTTFRIYDAVRAYEAVQDFTTMGPVVRQPTRTFVSLAEDARRAPTPEAQLLLRDELVAKLQRVRRRLTDAARDTFEGETGLSVEAFLRALRGVAAGDLPALLEGAAPVMAVLDTGRTRGGQPIFISDHEDAVVSVVQAYPTGQRPDDYLAGFLAFIERERDRLPALTAVLTRPSSLGRSDLLELRRELDRQGFSEAALRTAFAQTRQVDAAASIIGFIRAAAQDEAPQPFEARVDAALARLLGSRTWTPPQRTWLTRLASQLKANQVIDRAFMDEPSNPVRREVGGFDRLNERIFGGELPTILERLQDEVWARAG
ncbi:type I restriction-modification system endonuclease [Deinococcus petrolearius]|uniref:Type I restriction-modification system endonuclease n=1 Tax=Deinococcus petrolearius TaxID=1751295 RepID=A0ABW1DJT6_9DEIO